MLRGRRQRRRHPAPVAHPRPAAPPHHPLCLLQPQLRQGARDAGRSPGGHRRRGDHHGRRSPAPARTDREDARPLPARPRPGHRQAQPGGRQTAAVRAQQALLPRRQHLGRCRTHRRRGRLPAALPYGRGRADLAAGVQPLLQGPVLLDRFRHRHLRLPQRRPGGRRDEVALRLADQLRHRRPDLVQLPPAAAGHLRRAQPGLARRGLHPVDHRCRPRRRRHRARLCDAGGHHGRPGRGADGDARADRRVHRPDLLRVQAAAALPRQGDRRHGPHPSPGGGRGGRRRRRVRARRALPGSARRTPQAG